MIKLLRAIGDTDAGRIKTLLECVDPNFSHEEEDTLALCHKVMAENKRSSVDYVLALTVICVRGFNRLVSFADYVKKEFNLEKETAYRKVRFGKLRHAFHIKFEAAEGHGPQAWPAHLRPPTTERESRPFTQEIYTIEEQLHGWETAVQQCGAGKITEEVADEVMLRVAPLKAEVAKAKRAAKTTRLQAKAALESEIVAREADVASLKTSVVSLEKEVIARKAEVMAQEANVVALKSEFSALRGEVAARKIDVARYEAQVITLKTSVAALETEAAARRTEVSMHQHSVNTLRRETAALRAETEKLETVLRRRQLFRYRVFCISQVGAGALSISLSAHFGANVLSIGSVALTISLSLGSRLVYPELIKRLPLLRYGFA